MQGKQKQGACSHQQTSGNGPADKTNIAETASFTSFAGIIGFSRFGFIRLHYRPCLPSAFVAGGFLVAQLVLMLLLPNHLPFIAAIALSAS